MGKDGTKRERAAVSRWGNGMSATAKRLAGSVKVGARDARNGTLWRRDRAKIAARQPASRIDSRGEGLRAAGLVHGGIVVGRVSCPPGQPEAAALLFPGLPGARPAEAA